MQKLLAENEEINGFLYENNLSKQAKDQWQ